jgi:hypothetical protein
MRSEESVTMPPEVVRIRASSTVFVKASMRVKRCLRGMMPNVRGTPPKGSQFLPDFLKQWEFVKLK